MSFFFASIIPNLLCLVCGGDMSSLNSFGVRCDQCGHQYPVQDKVVLAWPPDMHPLSLDEAKYHDTLDEDQPETHQLYAWRNFFYHRLLWDRLDTISRGGAVLEIGAGSGFDAVHWRSDLSLTFTDISPSTLSRLAERVHPRKVYCIAADAMFLPFRSGVFFAVCMVAVWHHVADPARALAEAYRVLSPGGLLSIGVEPNTTYFRWIKHGRRWLCAWTHMDPTQGSTADAEMIGFTKGDILRYFSEQNWQEVTIRPMWLLSGFLHYGSEFFYRALRLRRRIIFPQWLERGVVSIDELLFCLPIAHRFAWHWIIFARK